MKLFSTGLFASLFTTKKELKKELSRLRKDFPFDLGQVVYDIQLRNEKGKYTKIGASRKYSTITEVVVDERNYFSLVARAKRRDVFTDEKAAILYLDRVCTE